MRKVIIMRGVSGAGKSTYVEKHFPLAKVVSADHYFVNDGKYSFDASKLPEAHGSCLKQFIQALEGFHDTVVVDNTNTTVAEIAPYYSVAQAYSYAVEIITIVVDPVVAATRNVHGVGYDTVATQQKRLEREAQNFPPWWGHSTHGATESA